MDDQIDPGDNFFGINLSDCVTVPIRSLSPAHVHNNSADDWLIVRRDTGAKIAAVGPGQVYDPPIGVAVVVLRQTRHEVTVAANSPSNAHTEPQDASNRPFDQVADIVTVTDEMLRAAEGVHRCYTPRGRPDLTLIYRAMAAVAPQPQLIEWSHVPTLGEWLSPGSGSCERPSLERITELLRPRLGVTEEMILAGIVAMRAYEEGDDAGEIIAVWDAMNAVGPAAIPIMDSVVGLKAANAHLTRELASARAFIERLKAAELSAMRVTPATQSTDAQQTASDIDLTAAPERRPDGTLKPVARAWEAPKRTTDVRRLGG